MSALRTIGVALPLIAASCFAKRKPALNTIPVDTPTTSCEQTPLWVGTSVKLNYIRWNCDLPPGQQFYFGNTCETAVKPTASCPDEMCTTKIAPASFDGGRGSVKLSLEFTPLREGPLQLWLDLYDHTGSVERRRVLSCPALPPPDLTVTCSTRDPKTGAFSPCDGGVVAGAEVTLEGTASVAGELALPQPQVKFDGDYGNLMPEKRSNGELVECTRVDKGTGQRSVRCTVTGIAAGQHSFELYFSDTAKKSMTFDVR